MKKLLSKIRHNLKNSGSSLVLVIVALGFVGILTGALLTAVGYAYRQKLYDYNAKSNFYYLEQAMDEIYSGLGAQTMGYMQEAYEETREKAIKYNTTTHEYENIGNENANRIFKDSFMEKVSTSDSYELRRSDDTDPTSEVLLTAGLGKTLMSFISNLKDPTNPTDLKKSPGTIELIPDNLQVLYYYDDGTPSSVRITSKQLSKIIIKNVTLRRTVNYNRSQAKGNFSQTISTDIEICRPDFDVSFDGTTANLNNLFEFCIISDSGVEVNQYNGSVLSINGNIYAANDFYNKKYNDYNGDKDKPEDSVANQNYRTFMEEEIWNKPDGTSKKYVMNPVSSNTYGSDDLTTLVNKNDLLHSVPRVNALYDGNNMKSKYSGFYVNGSNVNVFAKKIIVPGSISVMDAGTLNVYGIDGTQVSQADVWADEVVLGGGYQGEYVDDDVTGTTVFSNQKGSKANFTANMYIKDDTQIESDYSTYRLNGSYYGFGNSIEKDSRSFIPTTLRNGTKSNIYQEEFLDDENNKDYKVREHYNSSAFIVNGQHASVDLYNTSAFYIAGRSYIELSKVKTKKETPKNVKFKTSEDTEVDGKDKDGAYEYDEELKDYKTGESLAIKAAQLAYKPIKSPTEKKVTRNTDGSLSYVDVGDTRDSSATYEYFSDLPVELRDIVLFTRYFNTASSSDSSHAAMVPVKYVEEEYTKAGTSTKATNYYYYLDFDFAFDNNLFSSTYFTKDVDEATETKKYIRSADDLSAYFISDYYNYINYVDEYQLYSEVGFMSRHLDINGTCEFDSFDRAVLVNKNEIDDSTTKRTDVLVDVTNYDQYLAGAVAAPGNVDSKIYTSGAFTTSLNSDKTASLEKSDLNSIFRNDDNVSFSVLMNDKQTIKSTVLGETPDTVSSTEVNSSDATSAAKLSKEYEKHYNYLKWSLQDLPTAKSKYSTAKTESEFVDTLVEKKGEDAITPINYYFNFDKIVQSDSDFHGGTTSIEPNDLPLATINRAGGEDVSGYKVWVDYDDVHVSADSPDGIVTGMIFAKGDVYFDEDPTGGFPVREFNGIIITGGKVFVNNNITNINSSDTCKTILSQCAVKAKDITSSNVEKQRQALCAIKVLELFKDYEDVAAYYRDLMEHPENQVVTEDNNDIKNISTIDYSNVVRYNNWMKNVD